MTIRNVKSEDVLKISPQLNDWWGGREVTHLLPRFLFDHFQDTSFVFETECEIIGFLIGFYSQTNPEEAYIHLIGIHPEHRKRGIAKKLYETFFNEVAQRDVHRVLSITSPINEQSIHFHKKLEFEIIPGDKIINGVTVHTNYDSQGNDRVLFVRNLV